MNNRVEGTTSDVRGLFDVSYQFKSIHFSHLNYEKREIMKNDLSDTVYLTPSYVLLDEVVIGVSAPWIKKKLKEIEKEKKNKYQIEENISHYKFKTWTLTDTSKYEFESNGELFVPQYSKVDDSYLINPINSIVRCRDNTAKPEFINMGRMLYEDFIFLFDKSFINNCTFFENTAYKPENKSFVWLTFQSNKLDDMNGFIIIDTLNHVILEAELNAGTDYNIKTKTNAALRNLIKTTNGFSYDEWVTSIRTKYKEKEGCYQMDECHYKFYMKSKTQKKKTNRKFFSSVESVLMLGENDRKDDEPEWLKLPTPKYFYVFYTKEMQATEDALKKINFIYEEL